MVRSEGLDDNLSSRSPVAWRERTRAELPFLSPISGRAVTALTNSIYGRSNASMTPWNAWPHSAIGPRASWLTSNDFSGCPSNGDSIAHATLLESLRVLPNTICLGKNLLPDSIIRRSAPSC